MPRSSTAQSTIRSAARVIKGSSTGMPENCHAAVNPGFTAVVDLFTFRTIAAGVKVSVGVAHKTLADAQLAAAESNPR